MGTDVFMEWDNINDAEDSKEEQDATYLRAAIWMHAENHCLREIFGPEYWESNGPLAYDFLGNLGTFEQAAKAYLKVYQRGQQDSARVEVSKQEEQLVQMGECLGNVLQEMGWTVMEESFAPDEATQWIEEVGKFFEVGMRKQEQGRRPKVYIWW